MGSGGGQILRTALALSTYTGTPFRIEDIRANRPNPGLAQQHLKSVEAAARLCDAEVEGAEKGSGELTFRPGEPRRRTVEVDIGTAGSVTLLLQAVTLPAILHGATFRVTGGTDVKWSPTWDYLANVTTPLLRRIGVAMEDRLLRRGHYPKGGGEVEVTVEESGLQPLELRERGKLLSVRGFSHASNLPGHIAARQATAARKELEGLGVPVKVEGRVEDAVSTGTGITLWAQYEHTVLGGSALGERGKPAEEVGREAAENLVREMDRPGALDRHASDQVLPFVAVTGGTYTATERTGHLETNAETCRRFLDREIQLDGKGPVRVSIR